MTTDSQTSEPLSRTTRLLGVDAMQRLAAIRVILFGVGGVGSWCAEALVRSGVGHLTMVDPDVVDVSNTNRQLPALVSTVGRPKVEVLCERLLDINPEADIVARRERFTAETAEDFAIEDYDYVIDAIDSLADKMELILSTTHYQQPTLFSSMGAARKMDPMQVRVSEFWRVDGCPLAAALRKRMRRAQRFPERKFQCVWSPERWQANTGSSGGRLPEPQPGGTLVTVTASFGLMLASLVIRHAASQAS